MLETILGTGITTMNKVSILTAFAKQSVHWRKRKTKQEITIHCGRCYNEGNIECHRVGSENTA